jgi:hypothetical protein
VWSKNTRRYKEIVQRKIKGLLQHIEHVNQEENDLYNDNDLEELGEHTTLTSEEVKEQVQKLNTIIASAGCDRKTAKAVKEVETKLLPRLEKYEEQEKTLDGRNSYSKTDHDASFFRMKDGQLLPAYNIILGSENQFILSYTFHSRASETDGFVPHLERCHDLSGRYPDLVTTDPAYGSEENYNFLSTHNIGNYLKYNTFHLEQSKSYQQHSYQRDNFVYHASSDTYACPQGRLLYFKRLYQQLSDNGYLTTHRIYQCFDCSNCATAAQCKRGAGNRTIWVNPALDRYRAQARDNLSSDLGVALRKQRSVDIEPVLGNIKFNQAYNRFRLRTKRKANVEFALVSIAHNTKKIARSLN